MAVADVQRDGENEARLHRERLASSRPMDEAAAENRARMAGARPSDAAASENERRYNGPSWSPPPPVAKRPTAPVDTSADGDHEEDGSLSGQLAHHGATSGGSLDERLRGLYEQGAFAQGGAVEQKVEGLAKQFGLEQQLNRARRMGEQSGDASGGGGDVTKQAGKKGEPIDVDELRESNERRRQKEMRMASRAMRKRMEQEEKARKNSADDFNRDWGSQLIKMLWGTLWVTFGHSIYAIAIAFYAARESSFVRKWIPPVGEEWIPAKILRLIPKAVLIPLKLAETVGLAFVLFWVLVMDLTCLGLIALVLAIFISVAGALPG